jgi:flagellar biogenesis protein FliO
MGLLFLFCLPALNAQDLAEPAQALPEYVTPGVPPSAPSGLRVLSSLLIVVGLIVVAGFAARRFLPGAWIPQRQTGPLKLLQNLPLGTNRHLALIEVEGRRFLLGCTERSVNLVASLDGFELANEPPAGNEFRTVSELLEDEK